MFSPIAFEPNSERSWRMFSTSFVQTANLSKDRVLPVSSGGTEFSVIPALKVAECLSWSHGSDSLTTG